jgi:hypothetical protein
MSTERVTLTRKRDAYDIIILGHQEYVTQKEYDNLKKFVSDGGTMIILDGNVFYAEVKYDIKAQAVTLVQGHWWAFNGKSAWKSVGERWRNEIEWVIVTIFAICVLASSVITIWIDPK